MLFYVYRKQICRTDVDDPLVDRMSMHVGTSSTVTFEEQTKY